MGLPEKASKPPAPQSPWKARESAHYPPAASHAPRLAFAAKARYSDCMKRRAPALGFGVCVLAVAMLGWAPVAEAQFFWSPFFQQEQPKRQKVRPAKPKAPADDLPPIIPRESSTPPPPDDRPYEIGRAHV